MYNIQIRNCGLLSYGTVQFKWSEQTVWHGPMYCCNHVMACLTDPECSSKLFTTMYVPDYSVS